MRTLLLLTVSLTCCTRTPANPDAQRRAEQARAEFVRFGAGRYEVLNFHALPERELEISTGPRQAVRAIEIPFAARVRFVATFDTRSMRDWTVDQMELSAQAVQVLGEGVHRSGDESDVDAAAWFERTSTGARFLRLDRIQ